MTIELKALDTLFFRDGKPFEKGDESWAAGLFPPAPSVYYGSIRSAYIAQNLHQFSLQDLIKRTEELRIKQIYYQLYAPIVGEDNAAWDNFLPLPNDLVMMKDVSGREKRERRFYKSYKIYLLQQEQQLATSSLHSNAVNISSLLSHEGEEVEKLEEGIIDDRALRQYLGGKYSSNFMGRKIKDFLTDEPKVGIGRDDNTHVAQDSMLYRVGMQRSHQIKIVIDFDEISDLDFTSEGLIRMGGEGKTVQYRTAKKLGRLSFEDTGLQEEEQYFKLYLTTPAIFKAGWKPSEIFEKANMKVALISSAVGKPVHIGGFDIAKNRPKPMYRAVPAGSVYYFERLSGSLKDLSEAIAQYSVSEFRVKEGFGIAHLAKI